MASTYAGGWAEYPAAESGEFALILGALQDVPSMGPRQLTRTLRAHLTSPFVPRMVTCDGRIDEQVMLACALRTEDIIRAISELVVMGYAEVVISEGPWELGITDAGRRYLAELQAL